MKKLYNILFSMTTSVILLVIFAFAIGYATFIESRESTEVARKLVYNAIWFELLLGVLTVNLIGSVFKYEIFNKRKFSVLLFHFAFIVILIGAAITRYMGSEGIMHIREGETAYEISSDKTSMRLTATANGETASETTEVTLDGTTTAFENQIEIGGKEIKCELVSFIQNAVETIVPDPAGEAAISLFTMNSQNGGMEFILQKTEVKEFEGVVFAFENPESKANIHFYRKGNELFFRTDVPLSKTSMMEQKQEMILPGKEMIAQQKTIFRAENLLFVVKTYLQNARKSLTQMSPEMNKAGIMLEGKNALVFSVTDGNATQQVNLLTSDNEATSKATCTLNGTTVGIEYGTLTHRLPFGIKLLDFELERYPGSNSPSSYASEITVIDTLSKTEMPYRIFMNNILKYEGYRFFQSSYDQDEQGTILSVSNDYWGTTITYIGYFMLMFGMLLTMFNKNSRFRSLLKLSGELQKKRLKGKTAVLIAALALSTSAFASTVTKKSHIESLNHLLIQDAAQGRIEPFNTYTSDVFRKINKSTSYRDMSPTEVILGMIANPESWQNEPIIKVANDELAKELGAVNNYVSFNQLFDFDNGGVYRLSEKVDAVYKKEQTTRNKYDKELINIDERINICYQIFTGEMLHLFPDPKDATAKWQTAAIKKDNPHTDSGCTRDMMNDGVKNLPATLFENYLQAVNAAYTSGDWLTAENQLAAIKSYQKANGGTTIPSESRIGMEIIYNNLNLFGKLGILYTIIGLTLLIMYMYTVFKPKSKIQSYLKGSVYVFAFAFLLYTLGMAARWYISDHAPWSNGYEAMLFVGWATALSGIIFSRRSPVAMAVTGVLAAVALFVAGMSWMNPEITNLVPVLKSYWLIIHVAVITSSYGFLAMGALLGLLNLILMIARNKKNDKQLRDTIQEISVIIELALYIGLVLITSGCFIGGVWANESWGRYWGWDPKETWALVSILVYSAILHLRSIPKLNNRFILSALSLLGFSSIIMTFFGVNYYLSGMHSYGQGTPPPIPTAVYFVLLALAVIIAWAYKAEKKK